MGRKKVCQCFSCGTKLYTEDAIEERLDDEHSIYFCNSHCRNVTSDEEILKEKVYSLFKTIINTKTLNKTVKGYLRNRMDDEYKDKNEILYLILKEKKEKIINTISNKNFENGVVRAKYILKCVEQDVFKEYKRRQKEIENNNKEYEQLLPTKTSIIRKIRDISQWIN